MPTITRNWFAKPLRELLEWYLKRSALQLRIADCYRHQNQAEQAIIFLKKSICKDSFSSYLPENRANMMAWFPAAVTRSGLHVSPAFQGYYHTLERAACSIQGLYHIHSSLRTLWRKRLTRHLVRGTWQQQLCRRVAQRRRFTHKFVANIRNHIWLHYIIPVARAKTVLKYCTLVAVRNYIRNQAAIKIQTMLRNRRLFLILSATALKVQALWRGCSCRAAFRRACVQLYRNFRKEEVHRVEEAVKDEGSQTLE